MFAIEFNTKIDHGSIKIPEQYITKLGSQVKVIILANQPEDQTQSLNFTALAINTKGYKFNRELANER